MTMSATNIPNPPSMYSVLDFRSMMTSTGPFKSVETIILDIGSLVDSPEIKRMVSQVWKWLTLFLAYSFASDSVFYNNTACPEETEE